MSDDPYKAPESKPKRSPTVYWNIRLIPELSGLSRAEQKSAWRACRRKAFTHWQCWFAIGILVASLLATNTTTTTLFVVWLFNLNYSTAFIIGAVSLWVSCITDYALGTMQLLVRYIRPHLRTYLNDRQADE